MPRSSLSLVILVASTIIAPSHGQSGVASLLESSASSRQVEAPQVLEAAAESFERACLEALGFEGNEREALDSAPELPRDRRIELAEEASSSFHAALESKVSELRGDGLLLFDEVSQAIGPLREERLDELSERVEAEVTGHSPPPVRREFESDRAHRMALARYVLLERNSPKSWLFLLAWTVGGFVLAVCVLRVSRRKTRDAKEPGLMSAAQSVVQSLNGPLYLLLATGGLGLGLQSIWLPNTLFEPVLVTMLLAVALGFFWMTWRFTATVPARLGSWMTPEGESPGQQILEIARKVMRLGLILGFAFLCAEFIFGADLTALLAGVGIVGLAITLAAQDTLKDLFAALTIHVNRPFALGDLVRFEGYFGHIEEIGFRMTRIRTLDGHLVTIPNAKLVSDPVENVGARPFIRRRFRLDLPYDTPIEDVSAAIESVRESIRTAGGLAGDKEVEVHFDEFGPHSFKLLVQYYYESGDYWAAKKKATEIDLAIVECFRDKGVEFAFPTRTLFVHGEEPPEAAASEDGAAAPDGGKPEESGSREPA